ncbi:probable Heat shock protein STI1 [Saccharomycodes ludwigii]|uniref:Probable Heat shock protein STI1 n=1 Tax=Saccharomycodes ludwigii TaxID=36035 RepID=A0A376B2V1_9ASCO|nr:hypothetical protein SCDLUD_004876 [Saccharomycodes ludwigii]KAH3899433.1 hypothetical protein SCDLUD_004876 [Saccharomycodes ludwigii]SSD59003.1 probable Heat shock protein STI1 [Saccharomycodes ludwigii]
MSTADEYKQQGNACFTNKDYEGAIDFFTKAISASPEPNHVLFSNRSACYTSLQKFSQALKDAEQCVEINPTWAKGYNRVGAAQYGLGNLDEAEKCYKKCLELDANNKIAKEGLEQVEKVQKSRFEEPDLGIGAMFKDPQLIEKLSKNPKVAELMKDPSMVAKLKQFQSNPSAMGPQLLSDPKLMQVLAAMMGVDLSMGNESNSLPKDDYPGATGSTSTEESKNKEEEKKQKHESENVQETKKEDIQEPEPAADQDKSKAENLKAEGNKLYKQKKFDEAIALYDQAWDTFKDVTFLNNKAAAEYEMGEYETAISTLTNAVEQARELRTDYKIVAKSFARIGNSYLKLNNLPKAIEFYQKSLTEHRTPDVLNKLRSCEKDLKKQKELEYINPEKAEEARLQGKDYFVKCDWPKAVESYTEMIKRAPEDPRGYSNRAAALAKLMSFPECIKDCDRAIEKDPDFVKAYIRKASAQIAVKEYASAIKTLDEARARDTKVNNGSSAHEIDQLYYKANQQRFQPSNPNETPEQAYARAMKDPEVAAILQDPVMQSILSQSQQNPAALNEHMKNPEIFKKIQTLVAAGIIRTR